MLKLTPETYHSVEAKREYMSASRYKSFCGCLGVLGCPARALAEMRGEWHEEPSPAMVMSSFVDAHFSGSLDVFKAQNPEIFTKGGDLKANFLHAQTIIARIERDEYMLKCLSGEKQVIMTAEIHGLMWSIMIDSYHPGQAIVDLKVMADLNKSHWAKDFGRMSFVEYYGYLEQAAIYQAVVEKNTGLKLPFLIAAASKEEHPNIEVIGFQQSDIDRVQANVFTKSALIFGYRNGSIPPDFCGQCDYCREVKILTKPIHFSELTLSI